MLRCRPCGLWPIAGALCIGSAQPAWQRRSFHSSPRAVAQATTESCFQALANRCGTEELPPLPWHRSSQQQP